MDNLSENINLFQPTSFSVVIDRQNYPALRYFVQRVSHPGASNSAAEVPFSRVGGVPMPGNTMVYGSLNMDILLDEDFTSYIEMYEWMLRLVNEEQISSRDTYSQARGKIPTFSDIYVNALTNSNNKNIQFKYIDCVPVNIGDVTMEATNSGVDFITFNAEFRFSYFEIVTV